MIGRFPWKARYSILSILFVTSLISFMDKMVMSVAIPYISADFALTPWESGLVMGVFFAGYSISQVPGGFLADKFGVRKVATTALLWWSAFTGITGATTNVVQMALCRFVFGLGEGVFPACAFKAIAIWFPLRERATANAIKFAAGPLGAAFSPLVVVAIMSVWGWRDVFYILFVPGIAIALVFWIFVRDKPSDGKFVSAEELAEIEGQHDITVPDEASEKMSFAMVMREPNIMRYFLALFAFDIGYWGFTTWLPSYLVQARGFTMVEMGVAASLPYFAGTLGSFLGGFLSDKYFFQNRKALIIMAQLIAALLLYTMFKSTSTIVLVISQTAAGFFLNIFFTAFWAVPMNSISKNMMGVASGFINMAGQIAAFISPIFIGYLVSLSNGSFDLTFMFLIFCILASCVVIVFMPRPQARGPEPQHAMM